MRKSAKIITALSVTGLAVVAGSAFTGAGLTATGQASADQFIGGTVSQNVTGATLSNLTYGFEGGQEGPQSTVKTVTLKFAEGADGRSVLLKLENPTGFAEFDCSTVDATTNTSECTGTATSVTKASVTVVSATDQSTPVGSVNG